MYVNEIFYLTTKKRQKFIKIQKINKSHILMYSKISKCKNKLKTKSNENKFTNAKSAYTCVQCTVVHMIRKLKCHES